MKLKHKKSWAVLAAIVILALLLLTATNPWSPGDKVYFTVHQGWLLQSAQIMIDCPEPVTVADLRRMGPFHFAAWHVRDKRLSWSHHRMWPPACKNNYQSGQPFRFVGQDTANALPSDWRNSP